MPTPTSPFALRVRWIVWHIVIVAMVMGTPGGFWLIHQTPDNSSERVLVYVSLLALHAMLAGLLLTTPHDAMKLPVERSQRLILMCTIAIYLSTALLSQRFVWLSLLGALAALGATGLGLRWLGQREISPWVVVLIAWNPFLVAALTRAA